MRDLKTLKASDVMVRPVVSARLNASSRDVALQFLSGLYSGMPITDEEGQVVGVVSELDLLNAVVEGKELVKFTAEDLMSKNPVTADVETPVTDVVKLMKKKNVVRLPITAEGKLVGVVARSDILTSIIEPEFMTYM